MIPVKLEMEVIIYSMKSYNSMTATMNYSLGSNFVVVLGKMPVLHKSLFSSQL